MSPSEAVVNLSLQEQTRKVLATLTPREEKVLRMRFGIGEKSDHTLEEVGQDFDVTRSVSGKLRRKRFANYDIRLEVNGCAHSSIPKITVPRAGFWAHSSVVRATGS